MQELYEDRMLVIPYDPRLSLDEVCHVMYSSSGSATRSNGSTDNVTDYERLSQFGWLDKDVCNFCGVSINNIISGDGSW